MKNDWEIKTLGEVCEIKPPKSEARTKLKMSDLVSFLPMEDLGIFNKKIKAVKERKLNDVSGSYTYFADGDVLMAKITPCFENGKLGIAQNLKNGIGFGSSEFVVFRPKSDIDPDYLYYLLSTDGFREEGKKKMSGAVGHKRVSKDYIENYSLLIPPISDQKRIVKILDEKFEAIEKLKKITEQQIKDAKELFESRSREIFNQISASEKFTLNQLLEKQWIISHLDGNHGGDYPKKEEFKKNGVPYISANCLKNGKVDFSIAKYLSEERATKLRKGIAINGDVLFAHNATVGPVAILSTQETRVILSTSLTYYRCNKNHISNSYLAHFMLSPIFKQQYESVMKQMTRNQVPITKQREFYFYIPSISKQSIVGKELDELSEKTKELEVIFRRKITDLEELKKSYLHEAFTGNL